MDIQNMEMQLNALKTSKLWMTKFAELLKTVLKQSCEPSHNQ